MALLATARRMLALRAPVSAGAAGPKRGMADYHIPKPDTSMDHVFGDSSVKLPFNVRAHWVLAPRISLSAQSGQRVVHCEGPRRCVHSLVRTCPACSSSHPA
jgi:hypothetical protein